LQQVLALLLLVLQVLLELPHQEEQMVEAQHKLLEQECQLPCIYQPLYFVIGRVHKHLLVQHKLS
jgi:hypothetical protein